MPNAIDANVGQRIRHRRWMIGMTQLQLSERIGIKSQQIHKYETGTQRVSASKLWSIANALGVSINFFFDEGDAQGASHRVVAIRSPLEEEISELMRYYRAIPNDQRSQLFEFVRTLRDPVNAHGAQR